MFVCEYVRSGRQPKPNPRYLNLECQAAGGYPNHAKSICVSDEEGMPKKDYTLSDEEGMLMIWMY